MPSSLAGRQLDSTSLSWRRWVWDVRRAEHALGWTRAREELRTEVRGAPPAPGADSTWGPAAGRTLSSLMTQASVLSCSLLPSFQCRPNFSLPVSYLFTHIYGALLCARYHASPRGSVPSGAPALFSHTLAGAGPRSAHPLPPLGCSAGLQLRPTLRPSAVCRIASFGLLLASGFFVSPDSTPPPQGYSVSVLGTEQKELECGVGRERGRGRGELTTLPPDLGSSSLPSSSQ